MIKENKEQPYKLYVGGIPWATTEEELRVAFEQAGEVVSVAIIIDRITGRSRGFGFVEMGTEEEGEKAIEMFNGQDFGGRTLAVNEARPPSTDGFRPSPGGARPSRGGFGPKRGDEARPPSTDGFRPSPGGAPSSADDAMSSDED